MINLKLSKIYIYFVKSFTVTFLFLVFILYDVAQALPAFPGAEGYGANAIGGRGGIVIEVTNLNDSGPGSFREACEASGPRIVVFRTGGTIKLNSDVKIVNPYIAIAGQTAPGDGITLRAGSLRIRNSHEVIVRGLRMHLGRENGSSKDAFEQVLEAFQKKNFDGIDFVFSKDDPYSGIDLDNCINSETSTIEPWADVWINKFQSYTEYSPSKTGVHTIVKVRLPSKTGKKKVIMKYMQV